MYQQQQFLTIFIISISVQEEIKESEPPLVPPKSNSTNANVRFQNIV